MACATGLPASASGCAYCSGPTGGACQDCWDAAHSYTVCPPPFAYTITIGWGAVVNHEYRRLYCRDVTETELWPITGAMAQAQLSLAQIDALIVAQSGQPTCLAGPTTPPAGSPPAQPAAPTVPSPAAPTAPGTVAPTPVEPTPPATGASPPDMPFPSTGSGAAPAPPAGGNVPKAPAVGIDWPGILAGANKNGALLAVLGLGLAGLFLGGGGGGRRR